MKRILVAGALALFASAVSAQLPAFDATKRPTCTDGRPWAAWLLNQSSPTDCDATAGGTYEARCCCADGVIAACDIVGAGTVTSVALAVPAEWSVSGSPVTTSGTITISGEYSPNRPPSSCGTGGVCDEFTGGVTITFNGWGNQESSTATAERDGLTLYHPTDATGLSAYWFTGPDGSTTDWTFHARVSGALMEGFNQAGIILLSTGTEGTPTLLHYLTVGKSSATAHNYYARSATSYTSATTVLGTDVSGFPDSFLAMGYVSATKVLTFYTSGDGYLYRAHGSTTLAAHPTTSFGLTVLSSSGTQPAYGYFHFVRVRTDANRSEAGE